MNGIFMSSERQRLMDGQYDMTASQTDRQAKRGREREEEIQSETQSDRQRVTIQTGDHA